MRMYVYKAHESLGFEKQWVIVVDRVVESMKLLNTPSLASLFVGAPSSK